MEPFTTAQTVYDAERKLWYGEPLPSVWNPAAGIGRVVLDSLSRCPDRVIQINADTGRETTCADMKLRIIRVALHLRRLGYKRGDFVSIACGNGENVVPALIGCWVLGLAVNPLAPVFGREDFEHMMKQTQSTLVFCDTANYVVVSEAVKNAIRAKVQLFVMGDAPVDGMGRSVDELLEPIEGESSFRPEYLGDATKLLAMVLCSSGTTGLPKGVCLSHAHFVDGNVFSTEISDGPIFNFSSLFWATGIFAVMTSLLHSRPRVLTSKLCQPELLYDLIEKYRIENLFTPPAYVSALLAHPRHATADLSSVRQWQLGGSMVPPEMILRLQKHLPNGHVRSIYGSSEIGFITRNDAKVKPGSVGPLTTNVECRVVDEDGQEVGPGISGELLIRYRYMFLGYLHNEEATKNALTEDGFFRSGDIGYMEADGSLYVIDRIKDIIKYNNFQVSPSDLESIIQKIEGVKQVCVIGIPSPDGATDLPMAVVELKTGSALQPEDIVRLVDEQVTDFKRLRGGVRFVEKFPMTPSGKVVRRLVKKMVNEAT
ncbi:probable 4-coumarate--CoA ligase 3 [Anopheles maculipalpis]|uniref:probable 4-coumarate--CoA ligase 3 n=1 Tax=Anopheles maculipalpis TaxID=1496333 RepID=UPI002158E614|nr:probable 4-coumarate--CoA ligase 3 [Anopheles maculipalpis]